MEELLPEGFEELPTSDLEELSSSLNEAKAALRAIEKVTDEDLLAARALVEAISGIESEVQKRADRDAEFSQLLAEEETEVEVETKEVVEAEVEVETETEEVADAESEKAPEVVEAEVVTETVEAEVEVEAEVTEEGAEVETSTGTEVETETEEVVEAEVATETPEVEVETVEAEVAEVVETEVETEEAPAEVTEAVEAEVAEIVEAAPEVTTEEIEIEVAETEAVEAEVEVENIEEAEVTEAEAIDPDQEQKEMSDTPVEGALEADDFNIGGLASPTPQSNVTATSAAFTKSAGQSFDSFGSLANEVLSQFREGGGSRMWNNIAQGNVSDTVKFASVSNAKDDDLVLSTISEEANYHTINAAIKRSEDDRAAAGDDGVLVASGGICAPFEQDYSFFRCSELISPLESCLPRVAAPRGGIKYMLSPDFKIARQGITSVTCHEDQLGYESTPEECLPTDSEGVLLPGAGTTPDKPCVCVPCPEVAECCTSAVPWCVRWGNFNYNTFPELVENFMEDLMIAYAAEKEVAYLDGLAANSTVVDAAATTGAYYSVIEQIRRAASNYRRRNHMAPGRRLQLVAPSWLIDVFGANLGLNHDNPDPCITENRVRDLFRCMDVDVCFYYHTPSVLPAEVPSQAFDADQVAGPLNDWPAKAVTFLYAPGSFVRLDGGSLDFGTVRDSSLIATNDFIIAAEQFIGLCQVGCESLMLVHDINLCGGLEGAPCA